MINEDFYNWNYAQNSLEQIQELNIYLNNNKCKWTVDQLLERINFCQAWNSSNCVAQVAAKTNVGSKKVKRLAGKYALEGFKLKEFDPHAKFERQTFLPTEDEIKKECKKIRDNWSPVVERSRRRADWRSN